MGQCVTTAEPPEPQNAFVNSEQIVHVLKYVSDYLASKGAFVTLVAVGGLVDVLYLHLADNTNDIEFLGPPIANRTHLEAALLGALTQFGLPHRRLQQPNTLPVGESWMTLMETLQREPREVVFRDDGLEVVAAPWNYAFCVKMEILRLGATGTITATPRQVSDAARYLHQVIRHRPQDRGPFTERELYRVLEEYYVQIGELTVGHVLSTYRTIYNQPALAPHHG